MALDLVKVEIRTSADLAVALDTAVQKHADALLVMPDDPLLLNLRPEVVAGAARNRIPDIYWAREFVESCGLMSYGEPARATSRPRAT